MASRLQQLKEKWGSDKRKAEAEDPQSKRPKQLPVEQPVASTGLGLKAGIPLGRGRGAIRPIPNAAPASTVAQPVSAPSPKAAPEPVAPKAVVAKAVAPKSVPKAVVSSPPTKAFTPIPIVPPSQVVAAQAVAEVPKAIPAMATRKQVADQIVSQTQSNIEVVREYEEWLRTHFGDESLTHSSKRAKAFSHSAFKEVTEYLEAVKESHPDLFQ